MSPVVDQAHPRMRRRALRTAVATVVIAMLIPVVLASPASADRIGDMQRQAERMAAHLDDLEENVDTLSEDYVEAVYELRLLEDRVAQAQADMDAAEAALGQTRTRMQTYAVNAYVNVDQSSDLLVILGSQPQDSGARLGYADIAIGKDRSMADTFRSASEDAAVAKADLIAQRDAQDALQAEVNRRKEAAEGAVAAQQSALAKVRGDLASLVRQEQARRAAEAARVARARQQQSRSGRAAASSTADARFPLRRPGREERSPRRAASSVCRTDGRARRPAPASIVRVSRRGHGRRRPVASPLVAAQYASLPHVSLDQLQPGDLVFFGGRSVNHVGLYIGGGQMIHSPHSGSVVQVASIYRRGLIGAARP